MCIAFTGTLQKYDYFDYFPYVPKILDLNFHANGALKSQFLYCNIMFPHIKMNT